MKGSALLVAIPLALTWTPAQAQELQCLPVDEVERLANERKGDTWRHTDVVALTLTDICVVRISPVRVRINDKVYRWVGSKETGHWYWITSIKASFIQAFHRAGGKVVAGSDTPNPFVVPGVSLH